MHKQNILLDRVLSREEREEEELLSQSPLSILTVSFIHIRSKKVPIHKCSAL